MNIKAIGRMGLEKTADPSGIMAEKLKHTCTVVAVAAEAIIRRAILSAGNEVNRINCRGLKLDYHKTSASLISRLICQFQKMIP